MHNQIIRFKQQNGKFAKNAKKGGGCLFNILIY